MRATVLERLLKRAEAADLYRRRYCRVHPGWGDGTLGAAAWRCDLLPEPPLSDADYLSCLVLILERLVRCGDQPCAQAMHFGVVASSDRRFSEIVSPQSVQ